MKLEISEEKAQIFEPFGGQPNKKLQMESDNSAKIFFVNNTVAL